MHYPEIDAASLAEALASHHGPPVAHLLPGSGSTELIYLFPRVLRPRRALLVTPAFSEYERSLVQAGTQIDVFPLRVEEQFRLDPERLLRALDSSTDLVMLANPGNPTGVGIDPGVIEQIARAVREQAVVAVDEAFVDFCPHRSVLEKVPLHGNLYVFRSLTKFYAIPGLRVGYLAGPARGIARLSEAREPWALSAPALAAGRACLGEQGFRERTLLELPRLREELGRGLEDLGLTVFCGEANYLLARLEGAGASAAALAERLRSQGVLIRECGNFPPLDGRYLRVAVRTSEENRRLLEGLKNLLPLQAAASASG
ncbi:threonine-phosphate decarboxylase [Desulfuromonas versatilis]|uniref:Aminotransferase n=2 Tax=Desulfuromonas versatilis TaxID=2802975 RepID=A0ABM8HS25_9BACT|nr:threonine-phosphate decarboxylase [Desulfuromonas versatilis]